MNSVETVLDSLQFQTRPREVTQLFLQALRTDAGSVGREEAALVQELQELQEPPSSEI